MSGRPSSSGGCPEDGPGGETWQAAEDSCLEGLRFTRGPCNVAPMNTTTSTTVTATAALVRNDKLHLAEKDGAHGFDYPRCAGRRVSSPLLEGFAQAVIAAPAPGESRTEFAASMRALRREAFRNLSAQVTPEIRGNLCEKCTKGL